MGKKQAAKKVYEPIKTIFGEGDDYRIYDMTVQERTVGFGIGFLAAAVVMYIFFRSLLAGAIVGFVVGIKVQPTVRKYLCEKRKKNLLLQFKDMLEALTSSYSAGKNSMESFTDAYHDMVHVYGEDADIARELRNIVEGMQNNINLEELLNNFAQRSGLEDIASFASVFEVSLRQGANVKNIIFSTREIINDKIETEMEINTLLSGNKNELNIMMVMPLIIIVSLGGLGSGMTITANTPLNILIKCIVIGIFALAYKMGRKIADIKL